MYNLLVNLREILINDDYLKNLVDDRVSTVHISGLSNVVYPTITLCRTGGSADPGIDQIDRAVILVEIWSKNSEEELWSIYEKKVGNKYEGIRSLFHKKSFYETNLIINNLSEVNLAVLYEPYSETYHLSATYIAKTIKK